MVKVQVNKSGKVFASGGKALVAKEGTATKYGISIDAIFGDVDENGKLLKSEIDSDITISGFTDISDYGCENKFSGLNLHEHSVTFADLEQISGFYACSDLFDSSTVQNVSFPKLTSITGYSACESMFYECSSLHNVNFPVLQSVTGSNVFSEAFDGTNIETIEFPSLTTIGNSSMRNAFIYCRTLTTVSFPVLTTIENAGLSGAFEGCIQLTSISFPALTTTSFGSARTQFTDMMSMTGGGSSRTHTIHFPSNLESTIMTLDGYPTFGGLSDAVVLAFDLPATE